MSIFDGVLIAVIAGFTIAGFWFGLVHMIGSIVGIIVGALVAGQFFEDVAPYLNFLTGDRENLSMVIAFIVIFVVTTRVVGLLFNLVERFFKFVSFIPFFKTINRIAGALIGAAEGTIIVGLFLLFSARFPYTDRLTDLIAGSNIARFTLDVAEILAPLLPDLVVQAKDLFPF